MKKDNSIKQLAVIALGIGIALVTLSVYAQPTNDDIRGLWYAEGLEQSEIEIVETSEGTLEGIIRTSSEPDYVGQKVVYDLRHNESEQTFEGKIYAISRRMHLDGELELQEDGRLKVTGSKFFMTKTFYWEKR